MPAVPRLDRRREFRAGDSAGGVRGFDDPGRRDGHQRYRSTERDHAGRRSARRQVYAGRNGSAAELAREPSSRACCAPIGRSDRTPPWVATNRYHRSWKVDGSITIAGRTVRRRYHRDNGLCFGFINVDSDVRAIEDVQNHARYDELGLQHDIWVQIRDVNGRTATATMDSMFAAIGHGTEGSLWGYEGVGTYDVEEWGRCTGIVSFFWPARFTASDLHTRPGIENP